MIDVVREVRGLLQLSFVGGYVDLRLNEPEFERLLG